LGFVWGESNANKERSFCTRAIIAATKLNSQRPLRREVTRRESCLACGPPRINNAIPSVVSTSKAMANKANKRDQASVSVTRAWAKPRYHLASRKPTTSFDHPAVATPIPCRGKPFVNTFCSHQLLTPSPAFLALVGWRAVCLLVTCHFSVNE
jgi:hypothetical protein